MTSIVLGANLALYLKSFCGLYQASPGLHPSPHRSLGGMLMQRSSSFSSSDPVRLQSHGDHPFFLSGSIRTPTSFLFHPGAIIQLLLVPASNMRLSSCPLLPCLLPPMTAAIVMSSPDGILSFFELGSPSPSPCMPLTRWARDFAAWRWIFCPDVLPSVLSGLGPSSLRFNFGLSFCQRVAMKKRIQLLKVSKMTNCRLTLF